MHSSASVGARFAHSPASPVPPVMSSAGPLPRTSWYSLVVPAWISPDVVVVAVMIVLPFWGVCLGSTLGAGWRRGVGETPNMGAWSGWVVLPRYG